MTPMITGMHLDVMHPEERRNPGDLIGDLTIYFDHAPEQHLIMEVNKVSVDLDAGPPGPEIGAPFPDPITIISDHSRSVTITLKLRSW